MDRGYLHWFPFLACIRSGLRAFGQSRARLGQRRGGNTERGASLGGAGRAEESILKLDRAAPGLSIIKFNFGPTARLIEEMRVPAFLVQLKA